MSVVFDTATLPSRDRLPGLVAILEQTALRADRELELAPGQDAVSARMESWQVGPVTLLRANMPGMSTTRNAAHVRASPTSTLAVSLLPLRAGRREHEHRRYVSRPGACEVFDYSRPLRFDWSGQDSPIGMFFDADGLDLPGDTIAAATGHLHTSPLHSFLTTQLASMIDRADGLVADAGAEQFGHACIELIRAVLISAAEHGPCDGTAVPARLLMRQILDFTRRRATDPDLHMPTIAAAHHISVRRLYRLCAESGISLEQCLIAARLDHARRLLVAPVAQQRSIAAIAHASGFRDPTHFTRRFRRRYGLTPSQWRAEHPSPTQPGPAAGSWRGRPALPLFSVR
ncbi:helix-turn-helix transcriptional regulator [Nocardia sp. CA-151230]|uniref:helix-turn-helix transcriptional regulator n=1 Tax=Nocardia sp. CA-151230 TaxID=3239982 RepID=UPI003D8F9575